MGLGLGEGGGRLSPPPSRTFLVFPLCPKRVGFPGLWVKKRVEGVVIVADYHRNKIPKKL